MSVSFAFLRTGTSLAAFAGAALSFATIGSAVAQDQPAASPAAPPAVEEIVVTGSRIRTSDVTAASPLTVITSEQIQKSSTITMEDLTRKLPVFDKKIQGHTDQFLLKFRKPG